MTAPLLDRIVNAVLYEGYMLYPYRPSAVKNRQRFNFGVIYPHPFSEAQNSGDASSMQTECLLHANDNTECSVRVRFLRMVSRSLQQRRAGISDSGTPEDVFESVERLDVNGNIYQAWQEAAEETIEVTEFNVGTLANQPMQWPFRLSPWNQTEVLRDEFGAEVGVILWTKKTVTGKIDLNAERLHNDLFKLTVKIANDSRMESVTVSRDAALEQSLVSAHTILELRNGEFLSLTDPPEQYAELARSCHNVGTWPILVGAEGQRNTILSSPIILSDYPEIAPESPGDLFDGAEIDEILSLRILTMTDDEKREMRQCDARARLILERTENLPVEQWMKLHGALRGLRSTTSAEFPPSRKDDNR